MGEKETGEIRREGESENETDRDRDKETTPKAS